MQYDEKTNELYLSAPKYNSSRTISIDKNTIDLLAKEIEKQKNFVNAYGDLYTHYSLTALIY